MASSYQQAEQPESFLRSAQMSRVQLLLPAESVRNVVEQLGQLERISFDDVSTASFIAGPPRLIVVLLDCVRTAYARPQSIPAGMDGQPTLVG